jgi:hypothetical protein
MARPTDTPTTRDELTPDAPATTAPAAPLRTVPARTLQRGKRIMRDSNGKITAVVDDWIDTAAPAAAGDDELLKNESPATIAAVWMMIRTVMEGINTKFKKQFGARDAARAEELQQINHALATLDLKIATILHRLADAERELALKSQADPRMELLIDRVNDVRGRIAQVEAAVMITSPEE